MSLTVGLCDRLQIFDKLLENKHMNETNNDTNMTGNADNRSELRTQSGQGNPVSLSLRATYLWGTVLRIPFTAKQFWISLVSDVEAVTPSAIPSGRAGTGFCRPEVQPPPPPEPSAINVEAEIEGLEIRTCFMGHEFGEIEAVPLFRYRALQRALAEERKQRDALIEALKYIAHSGLSARHLADYALTVVKEYLK